MDYLAYTLLGVGAFLIGKSHLEQKETFSDISMLALDTRQSSIADNNLVPAEARTQDRGNFLIGQDVPIPDAATSGVNIPKFYNFPRKEALSVQTPEYGTAGELSQLRSTRYEQDRLAGVTLGTVKDFRDANGQIVDTNSTGQVAPVKQTALEAIVGQTPLAKIWDFDPHVVRVNDDANTRFNARDSLGRSTAISPQNISSVERPRPQDTFRRALTDEYTELRPSYSNAVGYSVSRPSGVDMGMNKDRTIEANHTTVTPYYGRTDYPTIKMNPVAESMQKVDYSPRPTITAQWDGPLTINKLQPPTVQRRTDLYDQHFESRGGVAAGQGWRQDSIDAQKRRVGDDPFNLRRPDLMREESPFTNIVHPQYQSRKAGDRVKEIRTFVPGFPANAEDMFTKPPPRGYAQGAELSPSVADTFEPSFN